MQVSQKMWETFPEFCKWVEAEIPKTAVRSKWPVSKDQAGSRRRHLVSDRP